MNAGLDEAEECESLNVRKATQVSEDDAKKSQLRQRLVYREEGATDGVASSLQRGIDKISRLSCRVALAVLSALNGRDRAIH